MIVMLIIKTVIISMIGTTNTLLSEFNEDKTDHNNSNEMNDYSSGDH